MARKQRHEDHQNHEAWAIPYADLLTLLLAFFVVMYAISSLNEGKYRILSDALNSAFNGTPANAASVRLQQRAPDAPASAPGGLALPNPLTAPVEPLSKKKKEDPKDEDAQEEGRARQLTQVAESVEKAMSNLIKEGLIVVRRKEDIVEVELRTDILFPSGDSHLTPQAHLVIERLGEALSPFPNALTVEGHTDDRPINTLEFPSNWELSSARAASVVHLLTDRGVESSRLTVVGHGEQVPIQPNETETGRNQNRRVVVVIRGDDSGTLTGPIPRVSQN